MIVVLVEDNLVNQRALCHQLSRLFSCQIKTFRSGQDAIEFFKDPSSTYDLIILDGNLEANLLNPKQSCNGPEVAEVILRINPKIPIIVWTDDTNMLKQFQKIFSYYKKDDLPILAKPCNANSLQEVVAPFFKMINSNEGDSSPTRSRGFSI